MAKQRRQTVFSRVSLSGFFRGAFCCLPILLVLLHAASGQVKVERVRSFGIRELSGSAPSLQLLQASDGFLYGLTAYNPFEDNGIPGGCLFRVSTNGSNYTVLHVFYRETGYYPATPLIEGLDGALYGATGIGGTNDGGTVFKINKDGSQYTVVRSFPSHPTPAKTSGSNPISLILGRDGLLYGAARAGGNFSNGVAFKMRTDGANFSVLHHFGGTPQSVTRWQFIGLLEGSDGFLYGTTALGTTNDAGTVFKLAKDGTGYTLLHHFVDNSDDGRSPQASLIEATDGVLYGTTQYCPTNHLGTVFKINRNGSGYSILHRFSYQSPSGYFPLSRLLEGSDGALYGTTLFGGSSTNGVIFKLNKDGSNFSTLHSLAPSGLEGREPRSGLIETSDGRLYGVAPVGGRYNDGALFSLHKNGSNFTVLRHFVRDGRDGKTPCGKLTQGPDDTLYGTTYAGGESDLGTIFKVRPDGSGYQLLHSFVGGPAGDGEKPWAGITVAPGGTLYGTTSFGGDAAQGVFGRGSGTLFRLNSDGSNYTILLRFAGSGLGDIPTGITLASDRALYGVTTSGIFRITTNGTGGTLLHRFGLSPTDGRLAEAGAYLLEASNGALYGSTTAGGISNRGIIFKINKDGSDYQILHHFTGFPGGGDGDNPFAGLFEASDGLLYGTTGYGGANQYGTVFRLNKDGSGYQILMHFAWATYRPFGGVVEGNDGLLYGIGHDVGFQLSKDGNRLVAFGLLGELAYGTLLRGSDGALYGTTSRGGSIDAGAIYRVSLPPAFLTHPQNITVPRGADVTFGLIAGGTPPLSYQWRWNGTNLPGASELSLSLANVARSDAGNYSLVISNIAGVASSSNAVLRVLAPQRFGPVRSSGPGDFSLQWSDDDGTPLTGADTSYFTVQAASSIPGTDWVTVTNAVVFSNGTLRIYDRVDTNKPARFYRGAWALTRAKSGNTDFQNRQGVFHFRSRPKPVGSNVLCPTSPFSVSRICGTTPKWRSSIRSPDLSTAPTSSAPINASPTPAAAIPLQNLLKPIRSRARKPTCCGSRGLAATSAHRPKRISHPFTRTG